MDEIADVKKILANLQKKRLTYGLEKSIRNLEKELELYKKYTAKKRASRELVDGRKIEKVQIGSGFHKLEGWMNLDLSVDADICWDIREGLPFSNNSIGTIFSEHTLEHIDYPKSVKLFYREAFRVLEPGGVMITGVPDGGLAARKYAEEDKEFFDVMLSRWYKNRRSLPHFNTSIDLLNYIFRDEDDDETYTPHLWGYDEEKLKQLADEAGFVEAHKWTFDSSIANPKREWASIYVICKKPNEV